MNNEKLILIILHLTFKMASLEARIVSLLLRASQLQEPWSDVRTS